MTKKTLLQKALESKKIIVVADIPSREEIELLVAYFDGIVSLTDVGRAYDRGDGYVTKRLLKIARHVSINEK